MPGPFVSRGLAAALLLCTACRAPSEGEIAGRIAFPSEEVPAMTLVLLKTDDDRPRRFPIAEGQERYAVRVEPGTYFVYAIPRERPDPLLLGAHTDYSLCYARQRDGGAVDEPCRTGPPREVTVAAGGRVNDADIDDWFLDEHVAAALLALSGETPQ
jgi:hypothetical protein